MRIKSKFRAGFLLCCISFLSCKKVIDVNPKNTTPQLVVDGSVTNQAGPYLVKLSQTININNSNTFPTVSGAKVIISDNIGNTETLHETTSGNYVTSTLVGQVGRTYNISISYNGKNYSGNSLMPISVKIDSLAIDTVKKKIGVMFKDTTGIKNYYHLVEFINGVQKVDYIIDDKLHDGFYYNINIPYGNHGDSVTVFLQDIDKNFHEYLRTLNSIQFPSDGIETTIPDNPTTNLSNNALGVFSAYAVTTKTIVIP